MARRTGKEKATHLQRHADVNTADTGDFTGLPSGWTTPAGGGLELITQYVLDGLGRPTKITSPAGNVTCATSDNVGRLKS